MRSPPQLASTFRARHLACRIMHVATLKRTPFLPLEGEQSDLYAPVWLSTTLVYLLAVAGNVTAWENNKGANIGLVMTGQSS